MDDFTVDDAVVQRLIIEEVEYVLDGARQDVVSTGHTEQRLKQVVDVQLQSALLSTWHHHRQVSSINNNNSNN